MHQVKSLLAKELILEWRSRYALNGILLYVVSTIFVCYLSFKGGIQGPTWNVLFWIILLFASINAMVKSFVQEPVGRHLYLYTWHPRKPLFSQKLYTTVCSCCCCQPWRYFSTKLYFQTRFKTSCSIFWRCY